MTTLQSQILASVRNRVTGFDSLPNGEKVLQVMAYLADVIAVREELGKNHGKWVDDFLHEAGGLGSGYPWCAASINWCAEMVGAPNPDKADAAVIGWRNWAKANGRLKSEPKRGYLCGLLHKDGTGHIGIVRGAIDGAIQSIEGNTSGGQAGSQRDGDGLYRRNRNAGTWEFFISLD
jgi:CHAP domain